MNSKDKKQKLKKRIEVDIKQKKSSNNDAKLQKKASKRK
jgi:hypothetical protein